MGTNDHERERVKHDRTSPPSGRDSAADREHALQAGKEGATQRKSTHEKETKTRDEGRDDRRSGSDSNRR